MNRGNWAFKYITSERTDTAVTQLVPVRTKSTYLLIKSFLHLSRKEDVGQAGKASWSYRQDLSHQKTLYHCPQTKACPVTAAWLDLLTPYTNPVTGKGNHAQCQHLEPPPVFPWEQCWDCLKSCIGRLPQAGMGLAQPLPGPQTLLPHRRRQGRVLPVLVTACPAADARFSPF